MKSDLLEFLDGRGCVLKEEIVTWAQNKFGSTKGRTSVIEELLNENIVSTCGNGKGIVINN